MMHIFLSSLSLTKKNKKTLLNILFSNFVDETHTFKWVPFPRTHLHFPFSYSHLCLILHLIAASCSTKAVRADVESQAASPVTKVSWHILYKSERTFSYICEVQEDGQVRGFSHLPFWWDGCQMSVCLH